MLCIKNPSTDPFFNLAAEEYFLKNFSENFFILWRNENAVIVGKHQNTLAEVNIDYIRGRKIPVVRRISGGGTVFHDLGNLNYTFIINGQKGQLVNFNKYTKPVLEVLQKLSVDASLRGKSDLVIGNKKISGNAMHVFKKRVLHHGTLLFDSDLNTLRLTLLTNPLKYQSKSVQSIRSHVTNIKEHLISNLDIIEFRDILMAHILKTFPGSTPYELSETDIVNIKMLRNQKYLKWKWNYGYSPKYEMKSSFIINAETLSVHLKVAEGTIQEACIKSTSALTPRWKMIESLLNGVRHNETDLIRELSKIPTTKIFGNLNTEEFVKNLF